MSSNSSMMFKSSTGCFST